MITFTKNEFNLFLSVFFQNADKFEVQYTPITRKTMRWLPYDESEEEREQQWELIDRLVGYAMMYTQEGSHINDSQLVKYYFQFKSPANKITTFTTRMSLMMGFNVHEAVTIH